MGLRPGQRHSGQFKSGHDSRRYSHDVARAKVRKAVEELCKEHAEDAVNYLSGLVMNEEAAHKDRTAAACELLDRGYGKPVDRIAVAQVGAQGGTQDPITELLAYLRDTPPPLLEAGGEDEDEPPPQNISDSEILVIPSNSGDIS